MAEAHSPLEQFRIRPLVEIDLGGIDASFTNSSLVMVIAVVLTGTFLMVGMRRRALVPGRWQSMAELSYEFVANLIRETVGTEGRAYFPIIFTLFMFILFGNMVGIAVTVLGFVKHGLRFFTIFVPPGSPIGLWPLLIPIEIISYLSRPISLSVRLFANMLAGHTLLKVFASFVVALGVGGVLPLAFIVALTGLEMLIAFLQAYVFAILTCLYINDALHLH
ncbi:MAG: F0F1 ATP synthase subunit A [Alphaproteobacteria bacterium]